MLELRQRRPWPSPSRDRLPRFSCHRTRTTTTPTVGGPSWRRRTRCSTRHRAYIRITLNRSKERTRRWNVRRGKDGTRAVAQAMGPLPRWRLQLQRRPEVAPLRTHCCPLLLEACILPQRPQPAPRRLSQRRRPWPPILATNNTINPPDSARTLTITWAAVSTALGRGDSVPRPGRSPAPRALVGWRWATNHSRLELLALGRQGGSNNSRRRRRGSTIK